MDYLLPAEAGALRQALDRLRDHPEDRAFLEGVLSRLERLAAVILDFPSLFSSEHLAGQRRGPETLVEQLVQRGPFATPLGLPIRAALARDFVLAKVQTFRAALLALEAPGIQAPSSLRERLRQEIAQSIYTMMGDRLLVDLIVDPEVPVASKRRAAALLLRFWERCLDLEIEDFCPLLESAWRARNRLVVEFGTLIGSVETVRLLASASDPDFVEALLQGDSVARRQAFEEFLFGLSIEELGTVRQRMEEQGLVAIDRSWVAETLGLPERELFSGIADPEAMFVSYQKRQLGASFRRMQGSAGPHCTAEAFLMLSVLEAA
jgi:hypothetical protein